MVQTGSWSGPPKLTGHQHWNRVGSQRSATILLRSAERRRRSAGWRRIPDGPGEPEQLTRRHAALRFQVLSGPSCLFLVPLLLNRLIQHGKMDGTWHFHVAAGQTALDLDQIWSWPWATPPLVADAPKRLALMHSGGSEDMRGPATWGHRAECRPTHPVEGVLPGQVHCTSR